MSSFDEIYTLFLAILSAGFVDRQQPGCPDNSTFDRLGDLKMKIHESCCDVTNSTNIRFFKMAFLLDVFFGLGKEYIPSDYADHIEFINQQKLMDWYAETVKLLPAVYDPENTMIRVLQMQEIFNSI